MATAPFIPPTPISQVSGPVVLTFLLNAGLLGVLMVQVLLYHLAFPKDPTYTKSLVYGIFTLELAQTVILVIAGFATLVTNFMDPMVFDVIGLLWLIPPMTAVATFFVQGYYAFRIRVLSKSLRAPIIIVALSIAQLGGGIGVGEHARQKKFYRLLNTPEMLILEGLATGFWNVGSVICDVIIAVYMTYYLSKYDARIRQTKVLLTKIIRLTIETGTVTTLVGMVCFGLAMIPGNPMYYQVPMGIIGKVYANSMLVLLNSRMSLTSEDGGDDFIPPMEFKPKTQDSDVQFISNSSYTAGPSNESDHGIMLADLEGNGKQTGLTGSDTTL